MESKAPFANCDACPLRNSAFVPSDPYRPDAKYTIVGEGPWLEEKRANKPFAGSSGEFLWKTLSMFGITREECNVTNATLCLPPNLGEGKEELVSAAAVCCRQRLLNEINNKPVLSLGKAARESMFPVEPDADYETLLNRWTLINNTWMIATLHPAYVQRAPNEAKMYFDGLQKFAKFEPKLAPIVKYKILTDPEEVYEVSKHSDRICFDLETDQTSHIYNDILLMSLDVGAEYNYIVPGKHRGVKDVLYSGKAHPAWSAFWSLDPVFVAHNGKFDVKFLRTQLGWERARCTFDTILAHYLLDENTKHGLKPLGARFLDRPDWETGLGQYLRTRNDMYSKVDWNVLCQYAATDTRVSRELSYIFEEALKRQKVMTGPHESQSTYEWPFMQLKMREQEMFAEIERRGFLIDRKYLGDKDIEFTKVEEDLLAQAKEISNGVIQNLNSPAQIAVYLYDVLGMPAPKGRKLKARSTNKEVIEQLKGTHPIIGVLKEHRKVGKVHSSYVTNILNRVDDWDVLHSDAQLAHVVTQRISVQDPASQTMPRIGDDKDPLSKYSRVIRNAFIARPGFLLGNFDYSQAELRIAAELSQDPFLLEVFRTGRSLHKEVALAMYGPNYTHEEYMNCKMFNFSYLYGGTKHSFAESAGLPITVAEAFVKKYDSIMPGLAAWKKAQEATLRTKGYLPYRTGSRRRSPYVNEVNKEDVRKESFNSPCQGQASQMTSLSAIRLHEQMPKFGAYILLLVHDSIIIEIPKENVNEVARLAISTMESTAAEFFPSVQWKAEAEVGERWGTVEAMNLS